MKNKVKYKKLINDLNICICCSSNNTVLVEEINTVEIFDRFLIEISQMPNKETIEMLISDFPETYKIFNCLNCNVEFSKPMIGGNDIYYNYIYQFMPKNGIRWEHNKFIEDNYQPGNLLDIGCGNGSFVNFSLKYGYNSKGIDFSSRWKENHIQTSNLFSIINIESIDTFLRENTSLFDYYTLWHVLEHVENPADLLETINKHSNNKAKLFIAVPSDKFYMTLRTKMPILNYPPHHLTRWDKKSLSVIAKNTGWKICDHLYEPLAFALRLYGLRLAKGKPLTELKKLIISKKFSSNALDSILDEKESTISIKIYGRIISYFLKCFSGDLSGLSQYVRLEKK